MKLRDVTIRKQRDGEGWDLLVNGKVAVKHESYAIVSAVQAELLGQATGADECIEVADVIRQKEINR